MKNIRKKALFIIDNVFYKGAFLNEELEILKESDIDIRDYNLISNITTGVIQNRTYLDYIIKKNSKIKFRKIHKIILTILEMGIYQILFLDRVPDYSIIDESVKLAHVYGNRGSAGYVNGMLRNILRNKDSIEVDLKGKEYLEVKYSHPMFYIDEILKDFSYEEAEELLKANNEKPPFTIRVNGLKTNRDDLKKSLEKQGYKVEKTNMSKDGLIVLDAFNIFNTKDFKDGDFYIQDEASSLVSEILNPEYGSDVLDLCSAPGGKSTHLSALMNNTGNILACDISNHKLNLIRQNIKRLETRNIKLKKSDAIAFREDFKNKFDYILVDAPCSGLGLYRRKPEIKWNRKEEDLKELSEIQRKILKNASMYLKKGGHLVYSTCTITKIENEDVIYDFLEKNENFEIEQIDDKDFLKLYPSLNNTDGFSIVKLKKIGD
ncbi:16S rRNA (cytosine(967)-C(5))-methyltransferase RsmB [Peptoniphilus stercorisuis]|uniref:16S rRNA (cytosine(967)-C(5))-methyltransferase n=1 Tax=Peptoniphilus stercorisuis TaxID=1436965 RepID=A0ABS4KDK6_9FIRM|nr:16S rRNA (cytosine(967)-C(5))-methyltransferase RsmB [Peptoniphilus stercorisuis]MBP2025850.1 16S rRNA (cytosine967-C5)-methyltransferase [Peptoniphilus stercorisuis]